jgi:DNA-binding MarR family transcriptional regulator
MYHEQGDEIPFSAILLHLYRDMARAVERRIGMSYSRLEVLHELMHAGEISQTGLQQRLGIEGSLMTRYVKQMEAEGLISRRMDPKDNRFTLVTLAPAGQQFLQELLPLREEFETRLLEGLSEEERSIMVHALKQVQDNLSRWQQREASQEHLGEEKT